MLFNIRGTSGSGKSTIVRTLLRRYEYDALFGLRALVEAYRLRVPGVARDTFIIGPYLTECGGCDAVQPFELIPKLIEKYAARGHVIFEGMLISTCYGVIGRLLERWGRDAVVLFLDTPVETCIARVNGRRAAKGDTRPFDPTLLAQKHRTIARLKDKLATDGKLTTLSVRDEVAADVMLKALTGETLPTREAANVIGIREFGDALIDTGDLDPIYIAMVEAKLPPSQLARVLLAYWCFYHLGVAAWISEQPDYWRWMKIAAANETSPRDLGLPSDRWPRASERRHFRGTKCINAVEWLSRHDPRVLVESLAELETEKAIIARTSGWPMFGPWVSFKIADMMERVWGAPIRFSRNIGLMYEGPSAGLELLSASPSLLAEDRRPEALYEGLLDHFATRRAPPTFDRACGPQEVETVLCKWKSYRGGHYAVGKDIREMRHALTGWGASAEKMIRQFPQTWSVM